MRILIVDDDVNAVEGYQGLLEDAGHETVACTGYMAARGALNRGAFDGIVTDVRLGAMNGLGLLIDAEALHPGVRKVVVSGFSDPVLRRDAEVLGAAYLVKPIDPATLLNVFASVSAAGT